MNEISTFDLRSSIVDTVMELFDTMLDMKLDLVDTATPPPVFDGLKLTGALSFAGDLMGSVNIQLSDPFANIMAAAMLGMTVEEIESDEEINDVILEVINIIGGTLKSGFNDAGLECNVSTPSITVGNDFVIDTLNMDRSEKYAFSCGDHDILVEIGIKGKDKASSEEKLQLTKININQFKRLDIISTAGDGVIELFDMMLSMEVILSDENSTPDFKDSSILGLVYFAGDVTGSINIQVSNAFARIITASMLDMEEGEIASEGEIKDVIGEMSNIIGGNLKAGFCDTGLTCVISPPTITAGNDFKIETVNMDRYENFAFRYKEHDISVEVSVKIDESAGKSPEIENYKIETVEENPVPEETDRPQPVHTDINQIESMQAIEDNLDVILDIPLKITVELGRTRMKINDLLKLGQGSTLALSNIDGETLNIFANNKLVARGEVIVENEKYGIRIIEIISPKKRIESLRRRDV